MEICHIASGYIILVHRYQYLDFFFRKLGVLIWRL